MRDDILENVTIECDRRKIASVIRNITTNAIKYTPKNGEVTVSVRLSNHMRPLNPAADWATNTARKLKLRRRFLCGLFCWEKASTPLKTLRMSLQPPSSFDDPNSENADNNQDDVSENNNNYINYERSYRINKVLRKNSLERNEPSANNKTPRLRLSNRIIPITSPAPVLTPTYEPIEQQQQEIYLNQVSFPTVPSRIDGMVSNVVVEENSNMDLRMPRRVSSFIGSRRPSRQSSGNHLSDQNSKVKRGSSSIKRLLSHVSQVATAPPPPIYIIFEVTDTGTGIEKVSF